MVTGSHYFSESTTDDAAEFTNDGVYCEAFRADGASFIQESDPEKQNADLVFAVMAERDCRLVRREREILERCVRLNSRLGSMNMQ